MSLHLEARSRQFLERERDGAVFLIHVAPLGRPEVAENVLVESVDLPVDFVVDPEEAIAGGGEFASGACDASDLAEERVEVEPVKGLGDQVCFLFRLASLIPVRFIIPPTPRLQEEKYMPSTPQEQWDPVILSPLFGPITGA